MTARAVRDDIQNVLDFLLDAELAIYTNRVLLSDERVGFHSQRPDEAFLVSQGHPDIDQFLHWVESGQYSAVLFDGSILQIAYSLAGRDITGHRLMYAPCPYDIDKELLWAGESLGDVIRLYRTEESALRSPVRFDFDPKAATAAHPASHLTFNGIDCRVPCVAPIHVLRFADFVFRNFYPRLHLAHLRFFEVSEWKHVGSPVFPPGGKSGIHITWDTHARESAVR